MRNYLLLVLFSCVLCNCTSDNTPSGKSSLKNQSVNSDNIQMLSEMPTEQTGVDFNNVLQENLEYNSITFEGFTQGAGVSILDANNDGLKDIYFSGNLVSDKLYINKGDFKFEDATHKSGINSQNWTAGTAIVDINEDGYDDIYVCKFLYDEFEKRQNLFYVSNGDGTYTERSKEYGVNDGGYSVMANFFDYDNDGDLDLYVANQPPNSLTAKAPLKGKIDYRFTDRFYKNENGKFSDVTHLVGIKNYCYSLSATSFDYNNDGYLDLYVAADYDEPDLFYRNNGNGTFTNVADEVLKHMSNFSMGVDISDINNDGHLDVYAVDMVAEDNYRQKTNMSGMNPQKFFALAKAGYHYQYMYNSMQLNNGDGSFSEIAQLSGISNTDWSWTPLFIDLDNDSYKDIIVTNGLLKEVRNKDFEIWRNEFFEQKRNLAKTSNTQVQINPMEISNRAPSNKIANFVYKNNGDLTFKKMNSKWDFEKETWSQGAAYADFDNDGDLDVVINNTNMAASIYRNNASENSLNNYINIVLEGAKSNINGIGANIKIYYGDEQQILHYSPYRGYWSTSERIAHFGLGGHDKIDRVEVHWLGGKVSVLENVKANQTLNINIKDINSLPPNLNNKPKVFSQLPAPQVAHIENEFNDYDREILLPYMTSTLGPVLAKADVNGDGLEDVFLGSSVGNASALLLNNGIGFVKDITPFQQHKNSEDGGAHFFDYDGDGDMDLYVASGGSEYDEGHRNYQDRLYVNNGTGKFQWKNSIPNINVSTAAVTSLDIDKDKDLDLFVGGRQIPGKYGHAPESYLLINENGKYVKKVIEENLSDELGMVTAAESVDLNADGQEEIIVAGEWMPVMIYSFQDGVMQDASSKYNLPITNGWWNCIKIADVDGDGDKDIVAGNLGKNIKYKASKDEPFKLYVDDFDNNGTNDVYLGYYQDGVCYPVRGRQCSSEQMPFVKEKFKTYSDFGLASIDKVLDDRMSETTKVLTAELFSSSIFINDNNQFKLVELPNEAQIFPVYGIAVDDFDKDGKKDIFVAGNMYNREVETVRSDAGKGCMLSYADGKFRVQGTTMTGVSADKDVRDVEVVKAKGQNLLVIANNNAPIQVYSY